MNNVHIFTDSLATLPQGIVEQLKVGIAPVYVVFSNAQVYKHTVDICTEEILQLVMETGRLPGIAAPTVQDLVQLFKPSVSRNDYVLFISMSAQISSTYKNAMAAARQFPKGQVTVMDSKHFSSATAMMILQAAKLAMRKRNMNTFEQKLQEYRRNLKEELFLDKLQIANPIGNIYGFPHRIISPLKLKQQLDIRIGKLNSVLRADNLGEKPHIDRNQIVISQTLAKEPAEYVRQQLTERYGFRKVILTSNINGLLSRSTPRSVGISYWSNSSPDD